MTNIDDIHVVQELAHTTNKQNSYFMRKTPQVVLVNFPELRYKVYNLVRDRLSNISGFEARHLFGDIIH